MHPEYTPAAARAVEAAQLTARRRGADSLQPVHLLVGLLEEEEGRAATLLARAGLVPDARRTILERQPACAPRPAQTPAANAARLACERETPLPMSPETQAVVEHARAVASQFAADAALSTEQLVASLLQLDTGLRQQLGELGLSWPKLEEAFKAAQGPPLRVDEPLQLDEPLRLLDGTERMDTARILDAAGNRAREALRVLEDYSRFALDDAFLCRSLKELRHELDSTLERIDPRRELGLAARDTLGDVGTTFSTPRERSRSSLLAVVAANAKRLEEALRSLEEFGKLHSPSVGQAIERMRYRSYTLERALVLGTTARERLTDACLYVLLSGEGCSAALDWTIQEAAAGGAQIFQLREKKLSDSALLERARQVRGWTRQVGAIFVVNDRPDVARLADADGVHLGQDDMPVAEARRILGPDALIGVSTHNLGQVRRAVLDGASYVGVGPTFASGTKEFPELAGLEFVRQATAETSLPAFVIGGVTPANVAPVVLAGGRRIAVSQSLCKADDPRAVAAELRRALAPPSGTG